MAGWPVVGLPSGLTRETWHSLLLTFSHLKPSPASSAAIQTPAKSSLALAYNFSLLLLLEEECSGQQQGAACRDKHFTGRFFTPQTDRLK